MAMLEIPRNLRSTLAPATERVTTSVSAVRAAYAKRPRFLIRHRKVTPFAIDAAAFNAWIIGKLIDENLDLDDLTCEIPSVNDAEPSHDLVRLVEAAIENKVITHDPGLELQVCSDEDENGSGFFVFVYNRYGSRRFIGLSKGWNELVFHYEDAHPLTAIRGYLEQVIDRANDTLA